MKTLEDLLVYVEKLLRDHSQELETMSMDGSDTDYYEGLVDAYGHIFSTVKSAVEDK